MVAATAAQQSGDVLTLTRSADTLQAQTVSAFKRAMHSAAPPHAAVAAKHAVPFGNPHCWQ